MYEHFKYLLLPMRKILKTNTFSNFSIVENMMFIQVYLLLCFHNFEKKIDILTTRKQV